MRTSFRTVNGVTILMLRGKITIDHRSQELRESVRKLLSSGTRSILLDLGRVNYVDSTGVEAIIASFTSAAKVQGSLKLLNLTPKVHHLLSITRLLSVLEVFDDEREALESFS